MKRIKAFICYSSEDKEIAGNLKRNLEYTFGFKTFAAHDDITVSEQWLKAILKELSQTDYIIPLISERFVYSPFANQESGIAFALNKKIIPIKLDNTNPPGFLSQFQAIRYFASDYAPFVSLGTKICLLPFTLSSYKSIKAKALDTIVYALENSPSFSSTKTLIRIICGIKDFDSAHLRGIRKAIKNNSQVRNEKYALPDLKKYLQGQFNISID